MKELHSIVAERQSDLSTERAYYVNLKNKECLTETDKKEIEVVLKNIDEKMKLYTKPKK